MGVGGRRLRLWFVRLHPLETSRDYRDFSPVAFGPLFPRNQFHIGPVQDRAPAI
jgi:hypothetical protein